MVFTTEQVTKTSACHNIIVILFSDLHLLHSTYIKLSTEISHAAKTIRPVQTVWPQSKSCSCYLEILMKIQRNLDSAAVNVFDTQIEMPPLHESVSRSIAAKYIRMTFRIQQAENKPKFFLSRPKFMAKPAYRSSNVTLRTAISCRHLLYYSLHYCGGRAVHHNTGVRTYGQMGSADPPGKWMKN